MSENSERQGTIILSKPRPLLERRWFYIGEVGVDTGLIWMGDPGYILHRDPGDVSEFGRNWDEFCHHLYHGHNRPPVWHSVQFPSGLCVTTFEGDGGYPVFARYGINKFGARRVAEAKIVFHKRVAYRGPEHP